MRTEPEPQHPPNPQDDETRPSILIVGGCPRSGTTALRNWLNTSPYIHIGDERFARRAFHSDTFGVHLFQPTRFLELRKGDRHVDGEEFGEDVGSVRQAVTLGGILGDKIPRLADIRQQTVFDDPSVRCLAIVRNIFDVASSYNVRAAEGHNWAADRGARVAIHDWNNAMVWVRRRLRRPDLYLLSYEQFFYGSETATALYDFLSVPDVYRPDLDAALAMARSDSARIETHRRNVLTPDERVEICRGSRFVEYKALLSHMRARQLAARRRPVR